MKHRADRLTQTEPVDYHPKHRGTDRSMTCEVCGKPGNLIPVRNRMAVLCPGHEVRHG